MDGTFATVWWGDSRDRVKRGVFVGMYLATVRARPPGRFGSGETPTWVRSVGPRPPGYWTERGHARQLMRAAPERRPAGRMRARGREAPYREAGLIGEEKTHSGSAWRLGWDSVGACALGRGEAFEVSGPAVAPAGLVASMNETGSAGRAGAFVRRRRPRQPQAVGSVRLRVSSGKVSAVSCFI